MTPDQKRRNIGKQMYSMFQVKHNGDKNVYSKFVIILHLFIEDTTQDTIDAHQHSFRSFDTKPLAEPILTYCRLYPWHKYEI